MQSRSLCKVGLGFHPTELSNFQSIWRFPTNWTNVTLFFFSIHDCVRLPWRRLMSCQWNEFRLSTRVILLKFSYLCCLEAVLFVPSFRRVPGIRHATNNRELLACYSATNNNAVRISIVTIKSSSCLEAIRCRFRWFRGFWELLPQNDRQSFALYFTTPIIIASTPIFRRYL